MKMPKKTAICITIIALFLFSIAANAQKITPLTFKQIPSKSQTFVKKYLPGQVAEHAFISRVTSNHTYNVVMRGRTEVIFNMNGEWQELDGHGNGLPTTMLPKVTQNYFKYERQNVGISRIVRTKENYFVTLSDQVELKFDIYGRFLSTIMPNVEDLKREVIKE